MLLKLREYIRREGLVSTDQLSRFFHIDEQALEPMLEIWVAKGVLVKHEDKPKTACGSGCNRCQSNSRRYYQFKQSC